MRRRSWSVCAALRPWSGGRYSEALSHFKAARQISDSVGPTGFAGGPWSHREQVILDIQALEQWEAERR